MLAQLIRAKKGTKELQREKMTLKREYKEQPYGEQYQKSNTRERHIHVVLFI